MIIVKLGGSLSESDMLINCLDSIEKNYQGRSVVIVPGGGAFADQVRLAQQHWRFDDSIAHAMALLAMQQMALLLKGLKQAFAIAGSVAEIHEQIDRQKTVIWSPDVLELDNAGIQPTWDITSDSLAAWLAGVLSASELVLVKSAAIDSALSLYQLTEQGIVDRAFCNFAEHAGFKTTIINTKNF
ncbi:MAG: amino acid kinase family protein [Methylovulum sp.]